MKVQQNTGWDSYTLKKNSVDKLYLENKKLSVDNFWAPKHLWREKTRRKQGKPHRFPPSLLSSRTVDFWNTLMPLRANCSCSSVSVGDSCSRSSFNVSTSDDNVGSDSQSSFPTIKENAARGTLRDTLKHTHSAFELLISRMVRLLNVLNEKSHPSSTRVFSGSNLEILFQPNSNSKENTELIVRDDNCRIASITSLSDLDYENRLTVKKWESSSKLEIVEPKKLYFRRREGFFSRTILVPKTISRPSKSALTKEELVYLLQYKKSLLSEYFQRKEDSVDFKNNHHSCDRKSFICGTQSDSRLQEHSLLQFVQFIRARKKRDTENLSNNEKCSLLDCRRSESKFTDGYHNLIRKRRVTFSDPLSEDSTTVLDRSSSKGETEALSAQNFDSRIESCSEIPPEKSNQSKDFDDSKPASSSLVSLKACFATLSLNSMSQKTCDAKSDSDNFGTEKTVVCQENSEDDKPLTTQSEGENNALSVKNSYILNESSKFILPSPLQNLSESGGVEGPKVMENQTPSELRILSKKILDFGTAHAPILDNLRLRMISKVDDESVQTRPAEFSRNKNVEKCLKRKIYPIETCEDCSDDNSNFTSNYELESESIRSKITRLGNIQETEISVKCDQSVSQEQEISDGDWNDRPSLRSAKTVKFKDCFPTTTDDSITNDHNDERVSTSESNGWFELSWMGCWEREFENNSSEDEVKSHKSKMLDGTLFSNDEKPSAAISNSQMSSHTTIDDEIQSENYNEFGHGISDRSSPSADFYASDTPSFTAVAASLEKENEEIIPWMSKSKDDHTSKPCRPLSKFNYGSDSNHSDPKTLRNVYNGIRNPEIWRAEVRSEVSDLYKSRKFSYKTPETRTDWLIQRLQDLKSNHETDYRSDYCVDSEIESDFGWERDRSHGNRSFSDLNGCYEKYKKFEKMRNRLPPDIFLENVFSSRKIIFNECRCNKNTPTNRRKLKLEDRNGCKHACFQTESHEQSNQNLISHFQAELTLDSETDDSDFASSNKMEFSYNSNRKDEHVNKMKCRKFVRSLRSVKSEEDRKITNARVSHMTSEKSVTPSSAQSVFSTRTVGVNVSEKQNCCTMMDVYIDTDDLCPSKPIETTNQDPDSSFVTANSICHSVENSVNTNSDSVKIIRTSKFFTESNKTPPKSELENEKHSERRISNVFENLCTQINDASNNLAKLRFSEIKTVPEKVMGSPEPEKDPRGITSPLKSCQATIQARPITEELTMKPLRLTLPVHQDFSKPLETCSNSKSTVEKSTNKLEKHSCPICKIHKQTAGRYALPACIVKGVGPDSKTNEKDPWNRVMEQAKAHHDRREGRHMSASSEMGSSSPSSLGYFERSKEEARVQLVQVKNNSSQANVEFELGRNAAVMGKIRLPSPNNRAIKLPPPAPPALDVLTSSHLFAGCTTLTSSPRTRSPKRNKKPQTLNNNMSNRLLYIISEKGETNQQTPIKLPVAKFFN